MAEIRITIPDDKAPLLLDAVTFYMQNEAGDDELAVTVAMALAWTKDKLISELRRLVMNYQEHDHRESFVFDDPTK